MSVLYEHWQWREGLCCGTFVVLRDKHEAVRTVRAIDGIVSGAARAVLRCDMECSMYVDSHTGWRKGIPATEQSKSGYETQAPKLKERHSFRAAICLELELRGFRRHPDTGGNVPPSSPPFRD
jgi:hypothetical protein